MLLELKIGTAKVCWWWCSSSEVCAGSMTWFFISPLSPIDCIPPSRSTDKNICSIGTLNKNKDQIQWKLGNERETTFEAQVPVSYLGCLVLNNFAERWVPWGQLHSNPSLLTPNHLPRKRPRALHASFSSIEVSYTSLKCGSAKSYEMNLADKADILELRIERQESSLWPHRKNNCFHHRHQLSCATLLFAT